MPAHALSLWSGEFGLSKGPRQDGVFCFRFLFVNEKLSQEKLQRKGKLRCLPTRCRKAIFKKSEAQSSKRATQFGHFLTKSGCCRVLLAGFCLQGFACRVLSGLACMALLAGFVGFCLQGFVGFCFQGFAGRVLLPGFCLQGFVGFCLQGFACRVFAGRVSLSVLDSCL